MNRNEVKELFRKYNLGTASADERKLLENWYAQTSLAQQRDPLEEDYLLLKHEAWGAVLKETMVVKHYRLWPRITVAAAVALAFFSAGLLYFNKDSKKNQQMGAYSNEAVPGKVGATLTLADGRKIKLSDATSGELAKESGLIISKAANGQLIYKIAKQGTTKNTSATAEAYHTLSTSNGEIFQLLLPDGSKVWLNAASNLSYSVSLATDKKRVVNLSGEAYFEVFKDKKHPFVVNASKQEIEVLGTHFNINSYADEKLTKTTLIEGLVKVRRLNALGKVYAKIEKENEALLHPGQQSSVSATAINVQSVDPEDAIAWKNGRFLFNDEPLESIMRKVSRWYNVDVVYNDQDIKGRKFYGVIDRFSSIDEVLKMLRLTKKVSFKIESRQITVFKAE
jgi:transmembrane sensor